MLKREKQKIKNVLEFTKIYNQYSYDKNIREAKCLDFQLEKILVDLEEDDRLAGRADHGYVGFSSQFGGIYTYFYHEHPYLNALDRCRDILDEEEQKEAEFAAEFWKLENTAKKHSDAFIHKFGYEPPHSYKNFGFANCDSRIAGTNLNYHKLMELGLDGLEEEIDLGIEKNGSSTFYDGLKMWLETIRKVCQRYCDNAIDLAGRAVKKEKKQNFQDLAQVLRNIQHKAPSTFLEGIQLMWIYSISCDVMNYGRMDDYLAPLYARDLQEGRIDQKEAVQLVLGLYKHFKEVGKVHDCRVIIGGRGRKHPKEADALSMVIMEASRRFKDAVPQLTLRYDRNMSEAVFEKALEVNGEGCTFPIIYSDVTNIPAIEKIYGVTREEAEQYVPFGCGEYVMTGLSLGTPNNGVNLLKALEVTLHNGRDAWHNVRCGIETGEPEDLKTFPELMEALIKQLEKPLKHLAVHKMLNYKIAGQEAPYLHLSLLMDDCIEKGLPLLEGGVRYLNAASEIFGVISCADSLTAIKKYVYEEKRVSLKELVEILDNNYEGREEIRRMLLDAPKYGNDDQKADAMAVSLEGLVGEMTLEAGEKAGLHRYGMVSVNNSMSAEWGSYCIASPCGRKKGEPMSNGNGPSIGADKKGITALLNSMAKFDASKHVGVINNVRFTKEMFQENRDKVGALLKAYFENGGVQVNITVIGKKDLENAMKEPEQYQNLLVRIGGFSARFVTLSPVVQREIIARTTYA